MKRQPQEVPIPKRPIRFKEYDGRTLHLAPETTIADLQAQGFEVRLVMAGQPVNGGVYVAQKEAR